MAKYHIYQCFELNRPSLIRAIQDYLFKQNFMIDNYSSILIQKKLNGQIGLTPVACECSSLELMKFFMETQLLKSNMSSI